VTAYPPVTNITRDWLPGHHFLADNKLYCLSHRASHKTANQQKHIWVWDMHMHTLR